MKREKHINHNRIGSGLNKVVDDRSHVHEDFQPDEYANEQEVQIDSRDYPADLPKVCFKAEVNLHSGRQKGDDFLPEGRFRGDESLPNGGFRGDEESLPMGLQKRSKCYQRVPHFLI